MAWLHLAVVSVLTSSVAYGQVAIDIARVGNPGDFTEPVFVIQAPGTSQLLHVVGKRGTIWVVRGNSVLVNPFLVVPVVSSGESGLLGMAFHPQFAVNGHVFVLLTAGSGSGAGTYIMRYSTDPLSPEQADPLSVRSVMFINRPPSTYNQGGWIGFGPDGYLYIASGNGGPAQTGAPLTTLLGTILRIDVDRDDYPVDPIQNYGIPPNNPLAGSTTERPEIWAYGLRNPRRNSFDRLTGEFWISDIHGDGWGFLAGEINFQPAGQFELRHYGAPCMSGYRCEGFTGCDCFDPTFTEPVMSIAGTSAAVGGYRYRGLAVPDLSGRYVFAHAGGLVTSFDFDGSGVSGESTQALTFGSISSLGEDSAGELYICSLAFGVFKVIPACPANCDGSLGSPRLSPNDFTCFINRFAAGDSWANCDGNTDPPFLTAADFVCFVGRFASGCS